MRRQAAKSGTHKNANGGECNMPRANYRLNAGRGKRGEITERLNNVEEYVNVRRVMPVRRTSGTVHEMFMRRQQRIFMVQTTRYRWFIRARLPIAAHVPPRQLVW